MEILNYFFENDEWIHLRKLSKLLRVSTFSAHKYLKIYANKEFLIQKNEGNLILYKGNIDNPLFRQKKIHFHIEKILASGLIEKLRDYYLPKTIVLFGSVSKGLSTKGSDIDLFVMSEIKNEISLKKYEKILGRKLQIFVMNKSTFLKNKELSNNIINGIILDGYLEVFV